MTEYGESATNPSPVDPRPQPDLAPPEQPEHEEARRLEQAKDIARRGYTPSATWAARVILDALSKAEQEREDWKRRYFELVDEAYEDGVAPERELERLREALEMERDALATALSGCREALEKIAAMDRQGYALRAVDVARAVVRAQPPSEASEAKE